MASTRILNNLIKLGVGGIFLGTMVNSTLYNGMEIPTVLALLGPKIIYYFRNPYQGMNGTWLILCSVIMPKLKVKLLKPGPMFNFAA